MNRRLCQALLAALLLLPLSRSAHASAFACPVDFQLFDPLDQTKAFSFDLSNIQTGTFPKGVIPTYGGGWFVMPVGEGGSGQVLVSQGAGFNPGWTSGYITTTGGGSLTANRVPFASAAASLSDDADLTFNADSLKATKLIGGQLKVSTGVTNSGGGMKHARTNTGTVAAGSTALITVTWTNAWADTNYTVVAQIEEATTSSLSLSVVHIESRSTTDCKVRVLNNALTGLVGLIHAIGLHD